MSPSRPAARALGPVLLAAALLAGAAGCGRLAFDSSIDVLLAGDERTAANVARLDEYLDGRALVSVVVRRGDLFSDEGAADLRALSRDLEALPGVQDVKSLTHSGRPVLRSLSLDPTSLLDKQVFLPEQSLDAAGWAEARRTTLASPLARHLLVSPDGAFAQVLVVAARDLSTRAGKAALRADVEAALARHAERFEETHVVAFPFLELELTERVAANLRQVLLVAAALIVAILLVTLRSPLLLVVLGALLALGMAALAGLFVLFDASVNLYTAMLGPLVAGLQLAFLVHLGTAWQQVRGETGLPPRAALGAALQRVLRPSLLAAATTILGLLSLLACDVGLVRTFGLLGAAAVAAVFAIAFGPPWLLARGGAAADGASAVTAPWAARLAAGLARAPRRALLGAGLLVLLLAPGALLVRTDARATEYLPADSRSARALAVIDEHLGGMNVFELELDSGEPGGVRRLPVLQFLESFRAFAARLPGVTAVYTYSQVLCLLNQLWQRDAPGSDVLPTQPLLLSAFALALEHSRFALLDSLVDGDARVARLILRTRDMPAREYLALLERASDFAAEERPEGTLLRARQGLHTLLEADQRLVGSQLRSLGAAVLLVGLALVALLGSLRSALIVLAVNLPPLALVAGILGYAGLPLNSVTVMVAALVLGVAVDDSIHWLATYAQQRRRGLAVEAAVAATLAHKLRPIACTTAVLCAALLLFALAPFPPVAHFGLLTAAALALALASVTVVLPALVLLSERPR